MTTFTEALIQIVPEIRTGGAAAVRSCLIGLGRQLQEEPDSQTHSLQTWWQWLDDEGYDRETFATILAQICKVRIGEQGLFELTSFITSSKDNADGIAILLEQVKQSHPSLLEEVETLESLALEEENQLGATAGGLSKGGKIGTAVGVVGVASLVGGGIYFARARRNRPGSINQAIRQDGDRVIENVDRNVRNGINEGVAQVEDNPQKFIDALKSNEAQPLERKGIADFTEKDLNDKAEIYAKAHAERFEMTVEKFVRVEVEKSYLANEEKFNQDMEKYFEDKGGGEETKLREAGVKFDWDIKAARQKDFEEFEKTTAYDNYVTMWGKAYDRSAAEKGREAYKKSAKSITQAYKDLIEIEKAYKEDFYLHIMAEGLDRDGGFASTDVKDALRIYTQFGTKLSNDIEKRAKDAKAEYKEALAAVAEREDQLLVREGTQVSEGWENEEKGMKNSFEDDLLDFENL